MEKLLLSVTEFGQAIGVGPTLAKKLVREGAVVSVKIGDRRLIPVAEVTAYVGRIMAEAHGQRRGVGNGRS